MCWEFCFHFRTWWEEKVGHCINNFNYEWQNHIYIILRPQSISLWEGKRRCGGENRACEMWPVRANCCCFFHIFTSSTSLFFTFLCIYLPCFNFFLSFSPKSHEILQAFTFQLWSYTVITSIWCILIFCGPYWWSLNLKFHDG